MTTTASKKDLHLAACAAAKVEGDARRAKVKAERAAKHQALIAAQKGEGVANREARIAAHVAKNQSSKKAANDDSKIVFDDASGVFLMFTREDIRGAKEMPQSEIEQHVELRNVQYTLIRARFGADVAASAAYGWVSDRGILATKVSDDYHVLQSDFRDGPAVHTWLGDAGDEVNAIVTIADPLPKAA